MGSRPTTSTNFCDTIHKDQIKSLKSENILQDRKFDNCDTGQYFESNISSTNLCTADFQYKNSAFDCNYSFVVVGRLYYQLLSSSLTSAQKIVLSAIVDLAKSNFAIKNDGINLDNSCLCNKLSNLFSPTQLNRHLNALAKARYVSILYRPDKYGRIARFIKVNDILTGSYIPIVIPSNYHLTNSEILFLSALLNKATFHARAGLDFTLSTRQIKTLIENMGLSDRTCRNIFNKFIANRAIEYIEPSYETALSGVFRPVQINQALSFGYSSLFNVGQSKKAQECVGMQALDQIKSNTQNKTVNKLVSDVDRKLTKRGYYKTKFFAEGYLDQNSENIDSTDFVINLSEEQKVEVNAFKEWQDKANQLVDKEIVVTDFNLAHSSKKPLGSSVKPVMTQEQLRDLVVLAYKRKSQNCGYFEAGKKRNFPQYKLEKNAFSHSYCWKKTQDPTAENTLDQGFGTPNKYFNNKYLFNKYKQGQSLACWKKAETENNDFKFFQQPNSYFGYARI